MLIGGGIGITPLLSMAHRLKSLGRGWQLHCCTRSRETAAFLTDLEAFGRNVVLRFDDQHEAFLDLDGLINGAPAGSHFYCCGPKPMLTAFEAAVQRTGIAAARVHVESFKPVEDLGVTTELIVELARSGTSVTVPTGTTILEALRAAGNSAHSSCESGICGECQVAVLDGIPDHRDAVLTDRERASNTTMMICCSGAKSSKLVLDL
ncbi:flavin reductase family protein [Rhodopseudomonas sp.]|uniref:flavin reductase family protein n=1 Tax=Rhodopseudomonas sp. TaxID=1078 RepID=UPI003B3A355A